MNLVNFICANGKDFAQELIEYLDANGWDSYSKKDIKLFLFYLAQKFGYISEEKVNLDFAKKMKMTKRRLKNVLLESQLRFGDIKSDAKNILSALFNNNETKYSDLKESRFVFNIRNPILREQVIDMLEENRMTPDFRNNKAVLGLDLSSFVALVNSIHGISENDIMKSLTDDKEFEIAKQYKDYINDLEEEDINFGGAISGFLKEKSVEKLGESFTNYLSQKLANIFKDEK